MTPLVAPTPPEAAQLFGDGLPGAERFAAHLAEAGVQRGIIGPREVPVLWSRHLLNCVAVAELITSDQRVVDVGSGAGLPGIALALARSDLRVDLVESLARRCTFLDEVVNDLGLVDRVRVVRGRAEDDAVVRLVGNADVVTARAVAPLERLVRWCLPLVRRSGVLLAIKGDRAEGEIAQAMKFVRALGGGAPSVVGVGSGQFATTVVRIERSR